MHGFALNKRPLAAIALLSFLVVSLIPFTAEAQRTKRKPKPAPAKEAKSSVKSIVVQQSFDNAAAAKLFDEAISLVNAKQYPEAAAKFEATLPYLRADEDKKSEANVLNNVGVTYALGGNHLKAGEYYEQSLTLAEAVHDDAAQASVLYNLGVSAYKLDKDPAVILDYFSRALVIYQRVKNRTGEADTLYNMGQVYQWNGESAKAKEYYNKSLQVRVQ
jgi:tetratricopeptide (TPR) repeat protein